ncbi:MAG: hypothetical protein ABL998_07045 [Planctomycetota bacterium]
MTGVIAATFGALGRRFQKRKRRARKELAELSAGVAEIARWQEGLVALVLLSLWVAGQRFVVASDPVRGNVALLEALASAGFAGLLILDGGRLAFEPRRAALRLALPGTGFGVWFFVQRGDILPLILTAGLWTLFLRAGTLQRLLEAHPDAYSARRLARLRGASGRRGVEEDVRAAEVARASERECRRTRRLLLAPALFGALASAWALAVRPENPRAFLERYRLERNAESANTGAPGLLSASWFGTDDGHRPFWARYHQDGNDPEVPDRWLAAFFPLADDSATLGVEFRVEDGWELSRERSFGPDLLTRLEAAAAAFRNAWEWGTRAELAALGPADPTAQRALFLRDGEVEPKLRSALGPHTLELAWQLEIAFPCEGHWLHTYWQEDAGRLVLTGAY